MQNWEFKPSQTDATLWGYWCQRRHLTVPDIYPEACSSDALRSFYLQTNPFKGWQIGATSGNKYPTLSSVTQVCLTRQGSVRARKCPSTEAPRNGDYRESSLGPGYADSVTWAMDNCSIERQKQRFLKESATTALSLYFRVSVCENT